MNCKVIKKWQPPPIYTSTPLYRFTPFLAKTFVPSPPPSDSNFGRSYPPVIRDRGVGVPTMDPYFFNLVKLKAISPATCFLNCENIGRSQTIAVFRLRLNILIVRMSTYDLLNSCLLVIESRLVACGEE